jgi:hypothetical protein
MEVVKEFVGNVLSTFAVKVKKEQDEECNLMCEEETLASEGNSNPCSDSPGKRIFTFSSDYKRVENLVYENLISALHRTFG